MPKGNTNTIRIGNLHLATARLPSHIHQSKSTVQGLVSFFTGYPPPKGSYLNIVLPTEYFLSFSTFLPLVNQGIHFFGFCFFHSFLLESYKGFNNAETCSWSGEYIRIANLHLATARLPSHIHQSKSTVQGLVSFFTGYPPPKGSYLNIVLPTEDFLSFPTCSPLVNQGIHFFCFRFFHRFYWKATKDSTTQKHVVGRVDTFNDGIVGCTAFAVHADANTQPI